MKRVAVVHQLDRMTAGQWLERIDRADVVAVLSQAHERLLGSLLTQLGDQPLICATTPVSEALKIVVGGLVVESVSRENAVELVEPYAFQAETARAILKDFDPAIDIDLLPTLAGAVTPLCFQGDVGDS
jgi:hypothetical protein